MSADCYPMSVLPHLSALYADYLRLPDLGPDSPLREWYAVEPAGESPRAGQMGGVGSGLLANALAEQNRRFGAGPAAFANIERLRQGARAIVTGQQVGLFGGPLLTLLKAATAVTRAREASARTGVDHVPVFWLATEDHDLAEANQCTLLARHSVETLRLPLENNELPVGNILLGAGLEEVLEKAEALLSYAPVCELLRACYTPAATFGSAFASLMARLFASYGLILFDASESQFHAMGASVLRAAIDRAPELEAALLERTGALEATGYHAQVLVKQGSSLLFLLEEGTGRRHPLRRSAAGVWKAGAGTYSAEDLHAILEAEPGRISPNALLRPIFQDAILPTAAYVGGPAEIAYFAQSEVLFHSILGSVTPVLPRFSATLVEPAIDAILRKDEVALKDIFAAKTTQTLAQRLGARAMPIEGKRRIAAAGNALEGELAALTAYLETVDPSLARSAHVSASKMRYQMNRIRRLAASFEVQKEASLLKHAQSMMLHLFPGAHPQERALGGICFLAQAGGSFGEDLIERLVVEAGGGCPGHSVVRL